MSLGRREEIVNADYADGADFGGSCRLYAISFEREKRSLELLETLENTKRRDSE